MVWIKGYQADKLWNEELRRAPQNKTLTGVVLTLTRYCTPEDSWWKLDKNVTINLPSSRHQGTLDAQAVFFYRFLRSGCIRKFSVSIKRHLYWIHCPRVGRNKVQMKGVKSPRIVERGNIWWLSLRSRQGRYRVGVSDWDHQAVEVTGRQSDQFG
jgi:hypothetical protein